MKKGKTVMPSRRLQSKGKMSTLQTGKDNNIMQNICQSFQFGVKTCFRGIKNVYFPDFSCAQRCMCMYIWMLHPSFESVTKL